MKVTKLFSKSGKIVIESKSVENTKNETSEAFTKQRFYALSRSHNQGMIIGSSYAHLKENVACEQVLDAATMAFVFDKRSVACGGKIATADGLGGSDEDPKENNSIAKIAQYACRTFVNSSKSIDDTLFEIAKGPANQSENRSKYQLYDSTCAFASAQFEFQQDGTYAVELNNVGDTCIVVIGANGFIKHQVSAHQSYRGFNFWSPNSVQMLASTKADIDKIRQKKKLTLQQGDIIITMSDGIWGEFAVDMAVEKPTKILSLAANVFTKFVQDDNQSICDLLQKVVYAAMANAIKSRNQLYKLVTKLTAITFPSEIKYVDQVITYLGKINKKDLADELYNILFEQGKKDGVCYFKDSISSIPLPFILHDLKNRTVGDCSTINAVRLPYRLDELVRTFIANPEKKLQLIDEIALYSLTDLSVTINRLANETCLINPKMSMAAFNTRPLFNKTLLAKTKVILIHYLELNNLVNSELNKKIALKKVNAYLKDVPLKFLVPVFKLIQPRIKVEKKILGYFRPSDELKLYQALLKNCKERLLNQQKAQASTSNVVVQPAFKSDFFL